LADEIGRASRAKLNALPVLKLRRTSRAGRKRVWGKRIPVPPSLFAAAEFRISLCEMRRLFTIFIFWRSIKVVENEGIAKVSGAVNYNQGRV